MFEFQIGANANAFDPLRVAQVAESIKLGKLREEQAVEQKEQRATENAFRMQDALAKMDDRKRAQLKQQTDDFARVAAWADTPEKWDQGVDSLAAQYPHVAQFKGQFSPQRREFVLNQARSVSDILDQQKPTDLARLMRERDALPAGDPRRATYDAKIAKDTTREDDRALVEIADPTSPTGTRMVPRSQAVGQPGKPGQGFSIETDPTTGRITSVKHGAGAGTAPRAPSTNLSNAQLARMDEDLVKNAVRIERLDRTLATYKPEYMTVGEQGVNWFTSIKERANIPGFQPSPEDKKRLADFTTFRGAAFNDLTLTLKEMSGGAVTPEEAERLLMVLGDPKNDSPTEFKAKTDEILRSVKAAQMRTFYLRQKGVSDLKALGIDEMPALVRKRESEIAQDFGARMTGATPDDVRAAVRAKMRQEFGI